MCGIAGIIGMISEQNRDAIARMSAAMTHRGPDGQGVWVSPPDEGGRGCLLAHRRLSILDLSDNANQPMVDQTHGKALVFNGEIYNYKQLRSELQHAGQEFSSSGDTAVLLRWLAVRGYEQIEKLRGMFAFAVWDQVLRQLVIARDPLGIKPLYVCANPDPEGARWTFIFASEVRAILASGLISRPRLNPSAVRSMIWNGYVMGPDTIVQGIESLSPGEYRVLDGSGREKRREKYWRLNQFATADRGEVHVAHALEESVKTHMDSDVPVGVFLSGGIDSSAVANLAKKTCGDVRTFTLTFEESQYNEADHARRLARAIGTEHHEILMTEDRFAGQLDDALRSLDQPTFDGLNSYCIARAVREAGMKVALSGCGGDELFGGYESFRRLPRLHRLSQQTHWMPDGIKRTAARAVAAMAGNSAAPQTRWAKLPGMVEDGEDMVALYQTAYSLFLPAFQEELLVRDIGELSHGLPATTYSAFQEETANCGRLAAVSVMETRCFLGQRLLRDADTTSMASSLELRTPITDSGVAEAAFGMKDEERFLPLGRKQVLRKAGLAGLDPGLFERPKSGFVMPFERWIRSALTGRVDQLLRDEQATQQAGLNSRSVANLWDSYQQGRAFYWSRIWAVYVLTWWANEYGVSI